MADDHDEEATINKSELPAFLRRKMHEAVDTALSDDKIAQAIGPEGASIEHTLHVDLPDGQEIVLSLEMEVWS
jgi:hypothetical protein